MVSIKPMHCNKPNITYVNGFATNIIQCIFLTEKLCILIQISLKIGSANGLVLNRWQTIAWTNDVPTLFEVNLPVSLDGNISKLGQLVEKCVNMFLKIHCS